MMGLQRRLVLFGARLLLGVLLATGLVAALRAHPAAAQVAPCSAATLSWSPNQPQQPGTAIALTSTATCGGTPQYRFSIQPPGGSLGVVQAYSASNSYQWNTSGLAYGSYTLRVDVRNVGSSADFEAASYGPYVLEPAECVGASLSFNPAAPQAPGTSVTATGGASCGGTPQYRFWVQPPGGSWSIVQDYSTSASFTWDTTGKATGTYNLEVDARNVGSPLDYESYQFRGFVLAAASPGAPGTTSLATPANGATGLTITPTLSWNAPTGAISGTTTYIVSIWDPSGQPSGHRLGDLPATTALSASVPAGEGLLYGQTYQWNVYACNGSNCAAQYGPWFSFTTAPQPATTLSGASTATVVNADFAGPPPSPGTVGGWTGSATPAAGYLSGVTSLQSTPLTVTYPSTGSTTWFRVGYRLQTATGLTLSFGGASETTPATQTRGVWAENYFFLPSTAGAVGQVGVRAEGGTLDLAYVERLDGPTGQGGPRLGPSADGRLPKAVGATSPGGVDLASGAFGSATTDLSLPGVLGLSFSRAYNSRAVTTSASTGALTTGPLGPKWAHNWQGSLADYGSAAVVTTPDGGPYTFSVVNGSAYAPQGLDAGLVHDSSVHWTLTTAHQLRYGFTSGRLSTVQDRNGNTTTLSYDPSGNFTQVADPGGRSLTLGYDASNRITSVRDSAGRQATYAYDPSSGDLTSVTDVLGGVTRYQYSGHWLTRATNSLGNTPVRNTYDSQGRVQSQLDALGGQLGYAYATPGAGATRLTDQRSGAHTVYFDAARRITDAVDATGNAVSGAYDADNNLTRTETPLGGGSGASYDQNGNLLQATDALNNASSATYNGNNDPKSITDALNNQTTLSYDFNGNLATVFDAAGDIMSDTVNSLGQLTAVQDGRFNSTSFGYSAAGDRTTLTDALNHSTTLAYDTAGRPTSATDALNHAVSATYNAAGQPLTETDPLNHVSSFAYDLAGRRQSAQDANGHTTSYGYDVRNLLTAVVDPVNGSGTPTAYGYDAAGNRTTVTDAKGQQSSYSLDANNQPLTVADARGTVLTNTYDAAGRPATQTDAKGQRTTYSYTVRNQLSGISYAGGASVGYQYDAAGHRTQMTDGTGTTTYSYDALGRLSTVTFPGSQTVSYAYDAAGNRSSSTYPGNRTVNYGYDSDERLASVADWNNNVTSYGYDAAGRLSGITLPSGTGISAGLQEDNANRLTSLLYSKGGSTVAGASYALDSAGNRTSKTITLAGVQAQAESYGYDALNRLTSVTPQGGSAVPYSFDAVGNRTSMGSGAGQTSYSYGTADELTSVTPPGQSAIPYSYDANGSLTGRGSDSFGWDAANRLSSLTVGGTTTSMSYRGDGLRATRTSGGVTTSYIWDVETSELLDDGTYQYVYGLGAGPLERVAIATQATVYYLPDGLGSTAAIVDQSGNTVQSYTYDAYGQATPSSQSFGNEVQYAGQQTDPSGLQYLRARYYDPATGQFLSRDAFSFGDPAGHRAYGYGGGNPASNTDPSGLDFVNVYNTNSPCPCYAVGAYNPGTSQYVSYGNSPTQSCNCQLPGNNAAGISLPNVTVANALANAASSPAGTARASAAGPASGASYAQATEAITCDAQSGISVSGTLVTFSSSTVCPPYIPAEGSSPATNLQLGVETSLQRYYPGSDLGPAYWSTIAIGDMPGNCAVGQTVCGDSGGIHVEALIPAFYRVQGIHYCNICIDPFVISTFPLDLRQ